MPLKIGIDASSLIAQKTGIGSFASHLLEEFHRDPRGIDFVEFAPTRTHDLNTVQRLGWEMFELPGKARSRNVDALYSPGFSPPPDRRLRKIVTVHDVIGLLFPKNVGVASRFYWSCWLPQNLKRAGRLVASSECTKRDLVRLLGIPEKDVEVVPLAVREDFQRTSDAVVEEVLSRYGIPQPFFIYVSTLEPRKNHLRLLAAFDRFLKVHPGHALVIAGKPAGTEKEIRKFIDEKKMTASVKLLGYVPEKDIISLYSGALGYVMISLYEGFGLPALEAMSCGRTGVVADNSSLPEVTGDTAWQVPPEDEAAIERALTELATDGSKRKVMEERSLARSRQFSIQKCGDRMAEIFKKEWLP